MVLLFLLLMGSTTFGYYNRISRDFCTFYPSRLEFPPRLENSNQKVKHHSGQIGCFRYKVKHRGSFLVYVRILIGDRMTMSRFYRSQVLNSL